MIGSAWKDGEKEKTRVLGEDKQRMKNEGPGGIFRFLLVFVLITNSVPVMVMRAGNILVLIDRLWKETRHVPKILLANLHLIYLFISENSSFISSSMTVALARSHWNRVMCCLTLGGWHCLCLYFLPAFLLSSPPFFLSLRVTVYLFLSPAFSKGTLFIVPGEHYIMH